MAQPTSFLTKAAEGVTYLNSFRPTLPRSVQLALAAVGNAGILIVVMDRVITILGSKSPIGYKSVWDLWAMSVISFAAYFFSKTQKERVQVSAPRVEVSVPKSDMPAQERIQFKVFTFQLTSCRFHSSQDNTSSRYFRQKIADIFQFICVNLKGKPFPDAPVLKIYPAPSNWEEIKIFNNKETPFHAESGPFSYPASTEKEVHWTTFYRSKDDLLSFDDNHINFVNWQFLQFPGLEFLSTVYHKKTIEQKLKKDEIALITGVYRHANVSSLLNKDVVSELQNIDISKELTFCNPPSEGKLFVLGALETITEAKVSLEDVTFLYKSAYNAFYQIKQAHKNQRVVIHTGLWYTDRKTNTSLSILIQRLAAQAAGIDELHYYGKPTAEHLEEHQQVWDKIKTEHKTLSADAILKQLLSAFQIAPVWNEIMRTADWIT